MNAIYYETSDSRKDHAALGLNFKFTKWGMLGGSPQGVYKAQSMQEAAALAALASDAKSGIWEITQALYELRLGIKETTIPMAWQTFDSSTKANSGGVPVLTERIKPTFDRSSLPPPTTIEVLEPAVEVKPLENASDALKTGKTTTEVIVDNPPPQVSKTKKK